MHLTQISRPYTSIPAPPFHQLDYCLGRYKQYMYGHALCLARFLKVPQHAE